MCVLLNALFVLLVSNQKESLCFSLSVSPPPLSLLLPLSLSLPPAQPLGELESVIDVSYSVEQHGFAIVLSSGRTAFVTGKSAKFEPKVCGVV